MFDPCLHEHTLGEERYYVENGCPNADNKVDGSFKQKSYHAGVRCCSANGTSCETHFNCPEDNMSYDNAQSKCQEKGLRLCTKEELFSRVCCETGGRCDGYLTWTATADHGKCSYHVVLDI